MDNSTTQLKNKEQIKRAIKKTRRKMTLRIVRIFILCMAAIFIIINIPSVLYAAQANRITEAQKAAMLVHQFSTPNRIAGYSVDINRYSYNKEISLFYNNTVGKNPHAGHNGDIKIDYSLLTRKLNIYYPISGSYMHNSRYENLEDKYKQMIDDNNATALRALEKNKDNTVALVDLSLNSSYSIDEILKLVDNYDIEINWFAIECGYEGDAPPSNIGMPSQQYYTFGFPRELYTPDTIFEPTALDKKNSQEYIEEVLTNIEWLKDNNKLIANNSNSVWLIEDKVYDYLQSNPIRCYGIQINGPTEEIYELVKDIDYNYINIVDIGYWYW